MGELQTPGSSVEQLLTVLTFRRADGREIALDECSLAQALSAGETVRAEEIVIQVPDGRSVTTVVNATPIRSQDGEIESVVVTLQDMTPLEELGRLRADLLGTVSHELRVPLTSIRGSATALLDTSSDLDPAELHQFLHIIVDQVDHMRELIGDLLDVARIETGTLPVSPEPAEVASLVDRARNTFLSGGGRHNLDLDLAPDLPLVMADRQRIVQVLSNLLSNAARHSLESSVIRVTAVQEDLHVAVSVADEGTGIPAERLPYLFRKVLPHRRRGTGHAKPAVRVLALPSARGSWRRTVAASGLQATAKAKGRNSPLPYQWPKMPKPAQRLSLLGSPPARSRRREAGERILVVDDDPQALKYIRDALSGAGFTPIVTADSKEALLLTAEKRPHLVLLDLVLPDSDGIDLMKDILRMADVPIIFVSGYGRDQVIAQAFEQGAGRLHRQALLADGVGSKG